MRSGRSATSLTVRAVVCVGCGGGRETDEESWEMVENESLIWSSESARGLVWAFICPGMNGFHQHDH
jgi:hypothetical protein